MKRLESENVEVCIRVKSSFATSIQEEKRTAAKVRRVDGAQDVRDSFPSSAGAPVTERAIDLEVGTEEDPGEKTADDCDASFVSDDHHSF